MDHSEMTHSLKEVFSIEKDLVIDKVHERRGLEMA